MKSGVALGWEGVPGGWYRLAGGGARWVVQVDGRVEEVGRREVGIGVEGREGAGGGGGGRGAGMRAGASLAWWR